MEDAGDSKPSGFSYLTEGAFVFSPDENLYQPDYKLSLIESTYSEFHGMDLLTKIIELLSLKN